MHNGQGSGSTETGAYTLNGLATGTAPARNPGAQFHIPTEDEWYKSAYYKGGSRNAGYWNYATSSNLTRGNTIGGGANQVNYYAGTLAVTQSPFFVQLTHNRLTDVGAFTRNYSTYGTFDQSGNLSEWNDLTGTAGVVRGLRRGNYTSSVNGVSSSFRTVLAAAGDGPALGFRLASPASGGTVPEIDPAGLRIIAALLTGVLALRERRRFGHGPVARPEA